jgi:hypothetical protein
MFTFINWVQENSQQLAIARAELGALELLDNSKTFAEAETYLQQQMLGGGDSRLGVGEQVIQNTFTESNLSDLDLSQHVFFRCSSQTQLLKS